MHSSIRKVFRSLVVDYGFPQSRWRWWNNMVDSLPLAVDLRGIPQYLRSGMSRCRWWIAQFSSGVRGPVETILPFQSQVHDCFLRKYTRDINNDISGIVRMCKHLIRCCLEFLFKIFQKMPSVVVPISRPNVRKKKISRDNVNVNTQT